MLHKNLEVGKKSIQLVVKVYTETEWRPHISLGLLAELETQLLILSELGFSSAQVEKIDDEISQI